MIQVERALTLWRDRSVSCETVSQHKAKKRSSAIIKTINKATGKESSKTTDFNQANWATVTDSYLLSIKKALSSESKFDLIINAAKSFLKITTWTGDTTAFNDTSAEQNMDERAFLCDDPDSDWVEVVKLGSRCPLSAGKISFQVLLSTVLYLIFWVRLSTWW